MVTVGAGEGGPGWRGQGERVPEIRSGVRYVQREGRTPGDQERVPSIARHMKISHWS